MQSKRNRIKRLAAKWLPPAPKILMNWGDVKVNVQGKMLTEQEYRELYHNDADIVILSLHEGD